MVARPPQTTGRYHLLAKAKDDKAKRSTFTWPPITCWYKWKVQLVIYSVWEDATHTNNDPHRSGWCPQIDLTADLAQRTLTPNHARELVQFSSYSYRLNFMQIVTFFCKAKFAYKHFCIIVFFSLWHWKRKTWRVWNFCMIKESNDTWIQKKEHYSEKTNLFWKLILYYVLM